MRNFKITVIAAVDEAGGIGMDGGLPWHLSSDLKFFKKYTMGKTLLMGSGTFHSLPRRLQGRHSIVLTNTPSVFKGIPASEMSETDPPVATFTTFCTSIDEAFALVPEEGELIVMGGASVYEQLLPLADKTIISQVKGVFPTDTSFPEYAGNWDVLEEKQEDGYVRVTSVNAANVCKVCSKHTKESSMKEGWLLGCTKDKGFTTNTVIDGTCSKFAHQQEYT